MATDFTPYANLRLLIPQPPTAPANFRSGVPVGTGSWVIECFARAEQAAGRPGQELPSIDPSKRTLAGYITAWATLPANTSWLAVRSAFTWTETGLAPSGLLTGMGGRGFLGVLPDLPTITASGQQGEATILGLAGTYGPGGIGAELRDVLGDAITVELQVAA
jgi:hypothetical protein